MVAVPSSFLRFVLIFDSCPYLRSVCPYFRQRGRDPDYVNKINDIFSNRLAKKVVNRTSRINCNDLSRVESRESTFVELRTHTLAVPTKSIVPTLFSPRET